MHFLKLRPHCVKCPKLCTCHMRRMLWCNAPSLEHTMYTWMDSCRVLQLGWIDSIVADAGTVEWVNDYVLQLSWFRRWSPGAEDQTNWRLLSFPPLFLVLLYSGSRKSTLTSLLKTSKAFSRAPIHHRHRSVRNLDSPRVDEYSCSKTRSSAGSYTESSNK